jgi:ABC-2 type transport system permease protein
VSAAELGEAGTFRPAHEPAPALRRIAAQAGYDLRTLLRNGEQLLLSLVLPLLLLVGLSVTSVPDLGAGRRIDLVMPGVLALAVLSTAFTGQAIALGFDRRYGVLRLLGTTPLGRGGLLAGRAGAVLATVTLQFALLGLAGAVLGWQPRLGGLAAAGLATVAGVFTFASLGLLLAGTLRAEAVLAGANLLWVLLVAGGGVLIPPERTGPLELLARVLPSGALGDAMRAALIRGELDLPALLVLLGWGLVAAAAAVRWFRWDA